MSAQAGIFYFDGRPIGPELPKQLSASLTEYGPNGGGEHVAPGLVMVYRALHVTPEDPLERQPYVSHRGNVMTWDGRLDNRDELILQLWRDLGDDRSDVALAMTAYEKWGTSGLARLIGEWSLAVYDADRHSLTLASDYIGVRPLYYYGTSTFVAWSSSLESLVLQSGRCHELEARFIVGYLSFAIPPDFTPYLGVHSVTPSHSISWDLTGTNQKRRFWSYPVHEIRYHSQVDYDDHLRELFRSAVRSRLRASKTVWSTLSGGIDSSSVVCMADWLIRESAADATQLETVSWVSNTSPESDERRFISVIEQQRGQTGHHLLMEQYVDLCDDERAWITPRAPAGAVLALFRHVASAGGRLLLTGHAGDAVMGNFVEYSDALSELLLAMRPIAALTAARAWAAASRKTIWGVTSEAATCLLPTNAQARRLMRHVLRLASKDQRVGWRDAARIYLLRPEHAIWWQDELSRQAREQAEYQKHSKRPIVVPLASSAGARHLQAPCEFLRLITSHPYTHRPLVEFVLGIPAAALCAPGQPRVAMRRAFAPFVPERVLNRFSKGYAAPFLTRATQEATRGWLSRTQELEVVKRGLVDERALRAKLAALHGTGSRDLANLPVLIKTEQWFEMRQQRLASAA